MAECTGKPLSEHAISEAVKILGVDLPAIWAVMTVETKGCGFLPDRRPVILFERHIFHARTKGRFDSKASDLSNPAPGGYGPAGAFQHSRLVRAITLDRKAALESTSWGLGQVMGFNAALAGNNDVEDFVNSMCEGEDPQFQAMITFIEKHNLQKHLKEKDWATFAYHYNGTNFQKNEYDIKLSKAYARHKAGPLPNLKVRAVQLFLFYLKFDVGSVDGWFGSHTQRALTEFQLYKNITPTGHIDDDVFFELEKDALSQTTIQN